MQMIWVRGLAWSSVIRNREEGRGWGAWGAGTGATGPAPQLAREHITTFSVCPGPFLGISYVASLFSSRGISLEWQRLVASR